MTQRISLSITLILLIGALLRIGALGIDRRFHPDEAWFSTFARAAALNGQWLLPGDLDKPPLAIYANALSMALFVTQIDERGLHNFTVYQGEFAARLPNTFASLLMIALIYAAARRVYPAEAPALIAALLFALSPFALAYSASAFTDGMMLLGVTTALCAALGKGQRRAWWAGLWLALAFACKPQALFYLPLLALLLWRDRLSWRSTAALVLPSVIAFALISLWDAARSPNASLWALAAANNDPRRAWLVTTDEIMPRLGAWLSGTAILLGSPTPLLIAAGALATLLGLRRPRSRAAIIDMLLLAWVIGYFALHWLGSFNLYDRYLLPLLPPLCLLGARGSLWLWRLLNRFISTAELRIAAGAVVIALVIGGYNAANGTVVIASQAQHNNFVGIDELANLINAKPLGAIVYDRWLGWQLGYYMGQWTDKRRVYYPTPAELAAGAAAQPDPAPRYFAAPLNMPVEDYLNALRAVGFAVEREATLRNYALYVLTPP